MRGRWTLAAALLAVVAAAPALAEQGVTDTEIVLGTVMDVSGPGAPIGVPMKQGLELGSQIINEKGGVDGRKLRVVIEDSGFDPKRAILATQKLLLQDKVFAFVSQMGTAIVKATMPMAIERGRPFLFPIALDPSYTEPPKPLVATWLPDYAIQFGAATGWAADKLGKKRFCVLTMDGDSGDQSLRGINEALKARNLAIVETASFKVGTPDLSSQIARLKAANCDVVMASLVVRDGASAVEKQKIGWDVDVFVAQSSTGAGMIALSGKAAEGIYGIQTSLPITAIADKPLVAEIASRFKQQYGKPMDEAVLSGYMSVLMVAEIARRAGHDLTVDGFVKALDTVKDYDMGLGSPPITFTPTQRLGSKRVYLLQVKNGQWREAGTVD